jgi:hypothetical protein
MPNRDQLEIIRDSGEIEFYGLDPAQGVTNIGRHPENDIVIEGPGIAPFHAMLDHRQKPYRLIVLSQEGETTLGGEHLSPNVAQEIHHWDAIGINGHTIMLLEDGAAVRPGPEIASAPVPQPLPERPVPAAAVPSAAPTVMVPAPPPGPRPTPALPAALPTPQRPVGLAARPPDQSDEVIVTELSEREWTINVEQTATLQVSIANGGPIVAMFQVSVEGLDGDWVTVLPPQVNLNEGQRATVTIAITPPRLPSSRAGVHHFAVVVTSPNHPGRRSQRGATLTLNPYYEFAIGELSPRQQSVSWFKQSGQAMLPVANGGNSNVLLRLEGADDERACSFEFRVPGEAVSLATQAETRLSPEEAATIPVRITPRSRRLISLRKHTYPFTITTTLLEGAQTPRMVLGQLKSAPLIGFWHILLMLLVLTSGIVFLFIPGPDPRLWSEQGGRVAATDNELTLSYNASRFKRLGPDNIFNRINGALLKLKIERKLAGAPDNTYEAVEDSLPGPAGAATDAPTLDVIYRLTVENFLSLFLPRLEQTATYEVTVVPVLPVIQVSPEETEVELGQPVTLAWTVEHADRLVLKTQDGLIIETFNQPEPAGSYQIKSAETDTVYIFEAYNLYTGDSPETDAATVKVIVPPPVIEFFIAQPDSIVEGTPVALSWRVTGADSASIGSDDPLDRPMEVGPAGPPISRQPTRTTLYTLKAVKKTISGEATAVASQRVVVAPAPTATPTPAAPEIVYFTADPTELVRGDESLVSLKWSIVGTTTNVEISGPSLNSPITNLNQEDAISVTVEDTTLFVLAAFNQDKKASQNAQIRVQEPTPTPQPTPTSTPVPPPARILSFQISSPGYPKVIDMDPVGSNPHRYQVQENTTVVFSWQVENAVEVTFSPADGASQEVGTIGQATALVAGAGIKNYTLVAKNEVGIPVQQVIEVTVVDQPPPDPPYNLIGVEDPAGNTNTLTWQWKQDRDKSQIVGFRVYRADVPGGSFELIPGADENNPDLEADASPKQFADSVSPTCGKAYYVVAVYLDIDDTPQESAVSTNSWYSTPCSP